MTRAIVVELRHGSVGHILHAGREEPSAIGKARTAGPLGLDEEGLTGDAVADRTHHGGPDKAVCVYPASRYDDWLARYGRPLPRPAFGENLLLAGVDEGGACVGDTLRIGTALVQVSQPRVPCYKPAAYTGEGRLTRDLRRTGWTGWYLRVLERGAVAEGNAAELVERPQNAWSVLRLNALRYGDEADVEALRAAADAPELLASWRVALHARAQKGERARKRSA